MSTRTAHSRLKNLLAALLLCATGQAAAEWGDVLAEVRSILMSADERWGGCMAYLSVGPETVLPSCAPGWVTFSCTGDFTDQVRAYRMLDVMQLAHVTGHKVWVGIQDDKKHNGYCFANRVDVWRD